jgi:serine/threonine protein kinase
VVIATIMYPVLEALEYVHKTGIHRDVKVGTMCIHSVLAAFNSNAGRASVLSAATAAAAAAALRQGPCQLSVLVQLHGAGQHTCSG